MITVDSLTAWRCAFYASSGKRAGYLMCVLLLQQCSRCNSVFHIRYYIRGECREGINCRFSHDSRDVPVSVKFFVSIRSKCNLSCYCLVKG